MSELKIENLHVYYGTSHIVQGISMDIKDGESVAYVGGNGAGKTTTFKAILGLVQPKKGKIYYNDKEINGIPTHKRIQMGIGYSPSDEKVFNKLSVKENLTTSHTNSNIDFKERLDYVYDIFPVLKEYKDTSAESLSGGQQQMLAIACCLMNNPDLLLLDEPTEGLAPKIVDDVVEALCKINETGHTLLIIEHNIPTVAKICDRGYVLQRGNIVFDGTIEEIRENVDIATP